MRFNGPEYDAKQDEARLSHQHVRIRELMLDGEWRTLQQIAVATKSPTASVSAQLRHLRKKRFGAYLVERRPREDRSKGLFEYRVLEGDGFRVAMDKPMTQKPIVKLARAVAIAASYFLNECQCRSVSCRHCQALMKMEEALE